MHATYHDAARKCIEQAFWAKNTPAPFWLSDPWSHCPQQAIAGANHQVHQHSQVMQASAVDFGHH